MKAEIPIDKVCHLIKEIYQDILNEARVSDNGIIWESTVPRGPGGEVHQESRFSLINGSSGVLLFLLEYYGYCGDEKLKLFILEAVKSGFNHYKENPIEIGFYNGRGGFIFILVLASNQLNEPELLTQCRELIYLPLPEKSKLTYNLDTGLAGLMLGMLHYLSETNDLTAISKLRENILLLLSGAKIKKDGIYWDDIAFSTEYMASFLYGNAGIVFLLKELKKQILDFNADKVIQEAVCFEDKYYDRTKHNWQNNFRSMDDVAAQKNLVHKLLKIKSNPSFSWAFGSPGVLLGRVDNSIFSVSGYRQSINDAYAFFIKEIKQLNANFTLLNGLGGLALSFHSLNPLLDSSQYLWGVTEQWEKCGYILPGKAGKKIDIDYSLFNGTAGVGYVLLQLIKDEKTSFNLLNPITESPIQRTLRLENTSDPMIPIKKILSSSSNRSFNFIEKQTYFENVMRYFKINKSGSSAQIDLYLAYESFRLLQLDLNPFLLNQTIRSNKLNGSKVKYIKLNYNCRFINHLDQAFLLIRTTTGVECLKLSEMDKHFYKQLDTGFIKRRYFYNRLTASANSPFIGSLSWQEFNKKINHDLAIGKLAGS